jgi:hypothetical protein
MLVRMTGEQISKYWQLIIHAIKESGAPVLSFNNPRADGNLLSAATRGAMQCWFLLGKDGLVKGLGTTTITMDVCAGDRHLYITSLYGIKNVSDEEWLEMFDSLRSYAVSQSCSKIIAYTDIDRILAIAESLKASTITKVITWEL